MIGNELQVNFLQPARIFNFLCARINNFNNKIYVYSNIDIVMRLPRDGKIDEEFSYFQDTIIKMSAFKFFNTIEVHKNLANIDFENNKIDAPEIVNVGKILVSYDIITNYIAQVVVNNKTKEILFVLEDAGEYTNKNDLDIIIE